MQLLRDDAVFEMPPEPTWFTGRELIGRFLRSRVLTEPGRFRMIPVVANGHPALAAYLRGHDCGDHEHSTCVAIIAVCLVPPDTPFNCPDLFVTLHIHAPIPPNPVHAPL